MNENEFEKKLAQSVKKIDEIEIDTPDLMFFTGLVKTEKKKIAKKQNIQFAVFIAASVFIVAALMLILFANIIAFGVLQAVLLVFFIGILTQKIRAGVFR